MSPQQVVVPAGHLSYDDAASAMHWCNSYTRLETMLAMKRRMFFADWWKLLGEGWSVCDNIALHEPQLRRLLQRAQPIYLAYMMDALERAAFQKLPRELVVYRGCYEINRKGLSWSLSKDVAARFPSLNRYRRPGDAPLLLTGKVDRVRCALKLGRSEEEIISGVVREIGAARLPQEVPSEGRPGRLDWPSKAAARS